MVMIDMKRMTIMLVGDVDKYDEDPHPRIVCSYARACVLFEQLPHPEMFKSLIEMLPLFMGLHYTSPELPVAQQVLGRGYCDRHWVGARPILLAPSQ